MGPYLGDYKEDDTIDFKWDTNDKDGASITRATDGTVSVYKGNNTTQTTAGITDTEDFDSLTGIHHCRIDLSADAFYVTGEDYQVVLSAATIDGETVNSVLATFSIENRTQIVDEVTSNAKTDIVQAFADTDIEADLQSITANSILDFMFPKIEDGFDEAAGPSSQKYAATSSNDSFREGLEVGVIFSDLDSADTTPPRNGFEFLGCMILNTSGDADMKAWHIIGGYYVDYNGGSPQIVAETKFGCCLNMVDDDWFDDTGAGGTRWSATSNTGEPDRSEGGWTFVVKYVYGATFPDSGNDLEIRSIAGTSLPIKQTTALFPDGAVYLDDSNGFSGTTYPVGTAQKPATSMDNAKIIADNNRMTKIVIILNAIYTPSSTISHMQLIGSGGSRVNYINPNSQDFSNCLIENLSFSGSGNFTNSQFKRCILESFTDTGIDDTWYFDCDFMDDVKFGEQPVIIKGSFEDRANSNNPCLVDFASLSSDAIIIDSSGYMELRNLSSGTVRITGFKGKIDIASSCTGGTIYIDGGSCIVSDSSGGGCTVTTSKSQIDETTIATLANQTTMLSNQTTIEGKIDTIDSLVDSIVADIDTTTEATATPAKTAALKDKINWMFAAMKNKSSSTSSLVEITKDDDTVISEATVSKTGSTLIRNKFADP